MLPTSRGSARRGSPQLFSFSIAETRATSPLAGNILGHVNIRVTHVVPHTLRPRAFAHHVAGMHGAEAPKVPLPRESAESESVQELFANIRGQIGFRVCPCNVRNRRAYTCV